MKHHTLLILLLVLVSLIGYGQEADSKIIDSGGSGPYKAVAINEKTLPDFVIYRPQNIKQAIKTEGKLPILIWANGGCMNSSIHHERLLTEVASQGYLIVAIGELQMTVEERVHEPTSNKELLKGINWIIKEVNAETSDYFNIVDIDKIAVCGMSCGGAQVMAIANDSHIKTYMMFNSGMGNLSMAGASKESLKEVHGNIIYILGGESDVAYANAVLDFEAINHVPVVFASMDNAGHSGTFDQQFGGAFARMTIDWLEWQFKDSDKSDMFLNGNLDDYKGWTVKAKNFD